MKKKQELMNQLNFIRHNVLNQQQFSDAVKELYDDYHIYLYKAH